MSRRITFCVLAAASALILTQVAADAGVVQSRHHAGVSGLRGSPMHGGAKRMHRRGRWIGPASGFLFWDDWPAYAEPYGVTEYPASVETTGVALGESGDHDRRDCSCGPYGYHPFGIYGYRPNGGDQNVRPVPDYVFAPNAKIISIDQADR